MDRQRGEHEDRPPLLGRARMAALDEAGVDVRDGRVERDEDDRSRTEPGQHLPERSPVERGHEEAERGSGEHHPGREAEERAQQPVRRPWEKEEDEAADRRREPRRENRTDGDRVHAATLARFQSAPPLGLS